jgi:hypothetical protein
MCCLLRFDKVVPCKKGVFLVKYLDLEAQKTKTNESK